MPTVLTSPTGSWRATSSAINLGRLNLAQRLTKAAAKRPLSIPFELAFHIRQRQVRALPDALIIGGQKCGTSSIYNYLLQHPQIAGVIKRPNPRTGRWVAKEVHYLNQRGANKQPARWYRAHFDYRKAGIINLEATPDYLTSAEAPIGALELIPQAKFIVVLRNPVDRAFSAYQHMLREGVVQESFAAHIERRLSEQQKIEFTGWDVLKKGRYAEGLERWFTNFSRSQFHIIDFRELVSEPSETVAGIINFLGLPQVPIDTVKKFNDGRYADSMDPDLNARLREYFEPHNRRLESLLGFSMGW